MRPPCEVRTRARAWQNFDEREDGVHIWLPDKRAHKGHNLRIERMPSSGIGVGSLGVF